MDVWQDFGQKIDLAVRYGHSSSYPWAYSACKDTFANEQVSDDKSSCRIKDFLFDYPEGTSVLKEIVQVSPGDMFSL